MCETLKHAELSGPQNTHKWNGIAMENARLILSNSKPEQNVDKGLQHSWDLQHIGVYDDVDPGPQDLVLWLR